MCELRVCNLTRPYPGPCQKFERGARDFSQGSFLPFDVVSHGITLTNATCPGGRADRKALTLMFMFMFCCVPRVYLFSIAVIAVSSCYAYVFFLPILSFIATTSYMHRKLHCDSQLIDHLPLNGFNKALSHTASGISKVTTKKELRN
jgi:hypothetical protein